MVAALAALPPRLKVILVTGYPVGLMVFAKSWSLFPKVFAAEPRGLIDAERAEPEIRAKEFARSASA
jgi:hypothetical protein